MIPGCEEGGEVARVVVLLSCENAGIASMVRQVLLLYLKHYQQTPMLQLIPHGIFRVSSRLPVASRCL
jgi:hypothetical protein